MNTGTPTLRTSKASAPRGVLAAKGGFSLVEIIVAMGVFALVSTSVFMTVLRSMSHREQTFQTYLSINALRDQVAEMQDIANLPQDLAAQEGIGAIYARYHNTTVTVTDLPSGQIAITCFANEATVPSVLGGPQDLNFDGDASDDLGNISNGSDLRLVPMTLVLTYAEAGATYTRTINHLLGKSTD